MIAWIVHDSQQVSNLSNVPTLAKLEIRIFRGGDWWCRRVVRATAPL